MIKVSYGGYQPYSQPPSADNLGPYITVRLQHGGKHYDTFGLIDSGADGNLFNSQWAKAFKLSLDPADAIQAGGVGGQISIWLHEIHVQALGKRFKTTVAFSDQFPSAYGLLGREGFFDAFDIGFDQAAGRVLYSRRS